MIDLESVVCFSGFRRRNSIFSHCYSWSLDSLRFFFFFFSFLSPLLFTGTIPLCYINQMRECTNYTLGSESLPGIQTQIKAFMCLSVHNYTSDWAGMVHFNFH